MANEIKTLHEFDSLTRDEKLAVQARITRAVNNGHHHAFYAGQAYNKAAARMYFQPIVYAAENIAYHAPSAGSDVAEYLDSKEAAPTIQFLTSFYGR